MQTFYYLHTIISDLQKNDNDVWKLLKEIEAVTGHHLEDPYIPRNMMVIHYLQEVRLRKELTKNSLDAVPLSKDRFLWQKLIKLQDTNPDIFKLCQDIGKLRNTGLEKTNYFLYAFLNKHLKEKKRKPKLKIRPL